MLSPINTFANVGVYKRFAELRERVAEIEVITRTEADKSFGITIHGPLGIYTFAAGAAAFDWESFRATYGRFDKDFYSRVIAKCRSRQHPNINDVLLPQEQATAYHCIIPSIHGNLGTPHQFEIFSLKKEVVRGKGRGTRCNVINFETDEEAENFRLSCYTPFYYYLSWCYKTSIILYHINYPWLGESVNPRTKIVGYKGEWTDDDLWEYFGFTEEEREKARATMRNIDYSKL